MKPILEVAYLTSDHGETLEDCPGCEICVRIDELMKEVEVDPAVKYKHLLEKGEDLTVSEIIYLYDKGVLKSRIMAATRLDKNELNTLIVNSEFMDKKTMRAVDKMAGKTTKFNMTPEKAKQLKAEGKNKTEIAKIAGVSPATYTYHENKWKEKTESSEKVAPLKVKEVAPERDHAEYTTVINDLKEKLRYSEQVVEEKDKFNRELADKNMRMAAEKIDLRTENNQLLARIEQLEQEKMDLHAAANDTEREAVNYLERESELLIDADVWKQQAQMYQGENKRLNENLSEVREELAKYKGENVLAKAFIKAVL